MKKIIVLMSLCALIFAACQKEQAEVNNVPDCTYTIKMDGSVTKTVLNTTDAENIRLQWKEGDKMAFQLSDDSVVEGIIAIDGDQAKVSLSLGGKTVTDCWFPYAATKPTGIAANQNFDTINIPLEANSISGSTITLKAITSWAIVRVPVKGDKTIKQVKLKNNLAGRPAYTISKTIALTDEAINFDFVTDIAGTDEGTAATMEVIVVEADDSHTYDGDSKTFNREYRRKASSTKVLVNQKPYLFPAVTIDNTGKYVWVLKGEDGTVGEPLSANAPFTYPFKLTGSDYFTGITRGADYWTEAATTSSSKNNYYLAPSGHLSNQGQSCTTWGSVAESKTTINGAADQVMRFPVHTGNYPIFAFKVTKLSKLGSGKVRLDVNSIEAKNQTGNAYIGRDMPVRYNGAAENKHQTLFEDDNVGIYYIDLSSSTVQFKNNTTNVNEALPNSRTLHFTGFNLQFRDLTGYSQSTCDYYWMGFFNKVDDLKKFAETH